MRTGVIWLHVLKIQLCNRMRFSGSFAYNLQINPTDICYRFLLVDVHFCRLSVILKISHNGLYRASLEFVPRPDVCSIGGDIPGILKCFTHLEQTEGLAGR